MGKSRINGYRRCVSCDQHKKAARFNSTIAVCDVCEDYANNQAEREKEEEFDREFNHKRFVNDNTPRR